ncbi:UDP-N-acetylenolpyruvoylglucosamine reductase [Actinokineospora bangkokensis]|uniref:UDP-N-acetylenolpyruvoylglucosamine reductase n=1 Tax=Actinokineospora bangkokensis TaxID=1193682 RepID=A0A1Q9LGM9_9PSEU|nr:UDP-N-acetylenolpyruvoylglucosamine reductase [Actinokineospora bangkokensis]
MRDHTTLRLGGPATELWTATTADEVADALRSAPGPVLVLGGGSNLVVGDLGFDGTAVRLAHRGTRVDPRGDGTVHLTVEGGEDWDTVVACAVEAGLGGLECLSGIPGLVGATPVQNVGAYGVEISQVLVSVDLLDRATGDVHHVPAADLGLTYRGSVLKGTDRAVVLRATFTLTDDATSSPIRYTELARALGVRQDDRVPAQAARDAVLALRRGKGMVLDPTDHDTWSAGSFFTNPVVPHPDLPATVARIATVVGPDVPIPQYPAGEGHAKLSAAWLIERAGFAKGHLGAGGRVGLSTKHTLALTNRGSATTADLLSLAQDIRAGVDNAFGVTLHPEPVLVNCSLA